MATLQIREAMEVTPHLAVLVQQVVVLVGVLFMEQEYRLDLMVVQVVELLKVQIFQEEQVMLEAILLLKVMMAVLVNQVVAEVPQQLVCNLD
jgi:hypothetical protein